MQARDARQQSPFETLCPKVTADRKVSGRRDIMLPLGYNVCSCRNFTLFGVFSYRTANNYYPSHGATSAVSGVPAFD